jgi:hypothetical protein
LSRIDYADAFRLDTGHAQHRTAVQWARAILEDASSPLPTKLLSGWTMIGFALVETQCRRAVLGWEMRTSTPEFVLLGAESCLGMRGQLLFKSEGDALLFATFVQHDNHVARAVWAAVQRKHLRIVANLLEDASRRLCRKSKPHQYAKETHMLAFRRAVESRKLGILGELLAEDAVIHSPVTFKPYYGRDAVIEIINIVSTILEDFAYQRQLGTETGADHALVFEARVGELSIQGCDFLHTNADGLIDELTVMFRPLKAILAFKDQMAPKLAAAMEAVADRQTAAG